MPLFMPCFVLRLLRALAFCLPFAIFLLCTLVWGHDTLDDPYITYRYARNLVRGHGLIWNLGETPVEGYTTFLWAVLHAPFIAAGISPLLVSRVVSALAGLAFIALLLSPCNQIVRSFTWRLTTALLFALCPVLHFYGQSGMETLVFTVFIGSGTLFWAGSRVQTHRAPWLLVSSCFFALAALTRPETILVFALISLFEWHFSQNNADRMQHLRQLCGPFFLIWAPYFLWRWHFYGYVFPNTYYAKHSGNRFDNLTLGLTYIVVAFPKYFGVPAALLTGVAMQVGSRGKNAGAAKEQSAAWPLLVIATAYISSIVWMGGDDQGAFASCRLLAPMLPLVWLALAAVCENATQNAAPLRQRLFAFCIVAFCLLAWRGDALMLFKWGNPVFNGQNPRDFANYLCGKALNLGHETPGDLSVYLRHNSTPQSLIAIPWAGRVPYYTDRPTLDTLGLNDRHIAHLERKQSGIDVKMDPEYVLQRRPEWIFVNVDKCYWEGSCSFQAAHGWKIGDKHFIDLLRQSRDYVFVPDAPTMRCAFRLRP